VRGGPRGGIEKREKKKGTQFDQNPIREEGEKKELNKKKKFPVAAESEEPEGGSKKRNDVRSDRKRGGGEIEPVKNGKLS